MITIIATYIVVGIFAGVFAGLLGIGGGLVIVPILAFVFPLQGIPHEHMMHLALGTSMASIVFTSISSFWAHHKRGAVNWTIVKRIVPGIVIGTFSGSMLASWMSTGFLKGFFVIFLYYVAIRMLRDKKPKASRGLPGTWGMAGAGGVIGVISSLVGVGGGVMAVPFLVWCNVAVHEAIGSAAAIGFPLAITGATGYHLSGLKATGLPEYSLGYIYIPALLGIVATSVACAPFGVRLAHSLPVPKLKRAFAVLLLVVGTKMLTSVEIPQGLVQALKSIL